ncbi:MAG TPA: subclass B3 metallo-beta-lactamase, partial [Dokdonella sp.]
MERRLRFALALAPTAACAAAADDPLTRPIAIDAASNWNAPQAPLRIHGDTYYVGMAGLSAVLIHGR